MDDASWLAKHLGPEGADALMPHVDMAERERLIRVHGYAKDNAWPPPLAERLQDPDFVRAVRESATEEGHQETMSRLLQAIHQGE
jgi:hypothetical protein